MLREEINNALKDAMKASDKRRVSTLRLINAEILRRETSAAERLTLTDPEILDVMGKMIKQRQESLDIYEKAGRTDLADKEKYEVGILTAYMPQQMGEAEIAAIIAEAIAATGAKAPSDMGKVMGAVKPRVAGKADMGKVSALIKSKLAG